MASLGGSAPGVVDGILSHVIYDDLFSTVPNAESGGTLEPEMDGNFGHKLIATGYESLLPAKDNESLPDLHPDWLTDAELRTCN